MCVAKLVNDATKALLSCLSSQLKTSKKTTFHLAKKSTNNQIKLIDFAQGKSGRVNVPPSLDRVLRKACIRNLQVGVRY